MMAQKYSDRLGSWFADVYRWASGRWAKSSLYVVPVMLIVTVAATAAVVAYRQAVSNQLVNSGGETSFDARQVVESTRRMCDAYARVTDAVEVSNSMLPDDKTMREAMLVGQRQVFIASDEYLSDALESSPAIPDQLKTAINRLISSFKLTITDSFFTDMNSKDREMIRGAAKGLNDICAR